MRPITSFALHALAATALTAFAALSAAAQFLALGDPVPSMAGKDGRGDKWIEIQGWDWGETRAAGKVEHEWKVEEGESAPPAPGSTAKFGAVSGAHRDSAIASPRDAASGQASGKRQHRPVTFTKEMDKSAPAEKRQHGWVTVSKPLDRGAVRVKVRTPWPGCAVGARYPVLTLGGGAERYKLADAVIADCASDSVSLNYAKVKVRGWNPEKKEE